MDYTKGAMFEGTKVYTDKTVASVVTMHSFKSPDMMYRIHQFFTEMKLNKLEQEEIIAMRELEQLKNITHRGRPF